MTRSQWRLVREKLHRYREVAMPDNTMLVLWDSGTVSLLDKSDGHTIYTSNTLEIFEKIFDVH